MTDAKWGNIRIRQEIIDRVLEFLDSNYAKKQGYSNISHFVDDLIRTKLKRFEYNNMRATPVEEGKKYAVDEYGDSIIRYKIEVKDNQIFCDKCNLTNCIHVRLVWDEFEDELIKNKDIVKKQF